MNKNPQNWNIVIYWSPKIALPSEIWLHFVLACLKLAHIISYLVIVHIRDKIRYTCSSYKNIVYIILFRLNISIFFIRVIFFIFFFNFLLFAAFIESVCKSYLFIWSKKYWRQHSIRVDKNRTTIFFSTKFLNQRKVCVNEKNCVINTRNFAICW